jgi:hypothetical protein
MICPLGEATEDAERWWQAYLLAENDQADELRQCAASGDEHARRQLASWLSDRARTEEAIEVIRPLADIADDVAELWLARWLAEADRLDELRVQCLTPALSGTETCGEGQGVLTRARAMSVTEVERLRSTAVRVRGQPHCVTRSPAAFPAPARCAGPPTGRPGHRGRQRPGAAGYADTLIRRAPSP